MPRPEFLFTPHRLRPLFSLPIMAAFVFGFIQNYSKPALASPNQEPPKATLHDPDLKPIDALAETTSHTLDFYPYRLFLPRLEKASPPPPCVATADYGHCLTAQAVDDIEIGAGSNYNRIATITNWLVWTHPFPASRSERLAYSAEWPINQTAVALTFEDDSNWGSMGAYVEFNLNYATQTPICHIYIGVSEPYEYLEAIAAHEITHCDILTNIYQNLLATVNLTPLMTVDVTNSIFQILFDWDPYALLDYHRIHELLPYLIECLVNQANGHDLSIYKNGICLFNGNPLPNDLSDPQIKASWRDLIQNFLLNYPNSASLAQSLSYKKPARSLLSPPETLPRAQNLP